MTVRRRLVLFGAVLPALALVLAVVAAGWLFRRDQLEDLDRRLLAQAAVESVGLFDGPGGVPHVHVPTSPIADDVKDFAPDAGLYDDTGALVARGAPPERLPARVPLVGRLGGVRLTTEDVRGAARRVLELPVRAPNGRGYTLWLGASLEPLERTMARFYGATLAAVGALALALLVVQLAVARRLARRIDEMIAFLPRLRGGDAALAPDPSGDELATLRAALRDVAARLAEARAEQDRLLASAAHELRTPLTVLRTEVDLALRKQREAPELRDALRSIRDDIDRLTGLANALLDLQAVRHLGFARVDGDLVALVREACAGFATLAEARGVELRITAPPRAPARFDERALRQALDNLLGNAFRHAPAGTPIEVAIAGGEARWEIAVTDRGPGVAAADAARLFEPFQRGSPDGPGAGLGLALVSEVAARHGGRAWFDTTHAPGARVVLEVAPAPPG